MDYLDRCEEHKAKNGTEPEGEVAYESLIVRSSYTVEMSFITNTLAEVETEERFRRYQQSSMKELSSPEFWQFVHLDQESDSSEEWGTT